jgi:hypothetical protein
LGVITQNLRPKKMGVGNFFLIPSWPSDVPEIAVGYELGPAVQVVGL